MGLRSGARRLAAALLVKEVPAVKNLFGWLTDPDAVGRKRTLAVVLMLASGAIKGTAAGLALGCADPAVLPALACKVDASAIGELIGALGVALDQYLAPGASAVSFVVGIWGVVDAWRKGRK